MAGAGSGKTRVLTHRIAIWLVVSQSLEHVASPLQARLLEKWRAAFSLITNRRLFNCDFSLDVRVEICVGKLTISYNRNFTIVDLVGSEHWWRILKNLNLDLRSGMSAPFWAPFQCKNDLIDEVTYENMAGDMYTEIVAKCCLAYQRAAPVRGYGLLMIWSCWPCGFLTKILTSWPTPAALSISMSMSIWIPTTPV